MSAIQTPMKPIVGDWGPPEPEPPGWIQRRRPFIAVAGMLLLGLVVGLVRWNQLATADPGLSFSHPLVFRSEPGELGGIRTVENRLGREVEIDFVRAGRLTVILELTNGGGRGVEVRDLPAGPMYETTIERVSWSSTDHTAPDAERARPTGVPFESFTLASGESVDIGFDLRFDECERTGGGIVFSPSQVKELTVAYKAFGFLRTIEVPFEGALVSLFDPGECESRIPR